MLMQMSEENAAYYSFNVSLSISAWAFYSCVLHNCFCAILLSFFDLTSIFLFSFLLPENILSLIFC